MYIKLRGHNVLLMITTDLYSSFKQFVFSDMHIIPYKNKSYSKYDWRHVAFVFLDLFRKSDGGGMEPIWALALM